MALEAEKLANNMKGFIQEANKLTQEDRDKAIDAYCKQLESVVYDAIKSITITIPAAMIQVQGTPSAQANINPIVLKDVVS